MARGVGRHARVLRRRVARRRGPRAARGRRARRRRRAEAPVRGRVADGRRAQDARVVAGQGVAARGGRGGGVPLGFFVDSVPLCTAPFALRALGVPLGAFFCGFRPSLNGPLRSPRLALPRWQRHRRGMFFCLSLPLRRLRTPRPSVKNKPQKRNTQGPLRNFNGHKNEITMMNGTYQDGHTSKETASGRVGPVRKSTRQNKMKKV